MKIESSSVLYSGAILLSLSFSSYKPNSFFYGWNSMEDIMFWSSFYNSPLICYIISFYIIRKAATDINLLLRSLNIFPFDLLTSGFPFRILTLHPSITPERRYLKMSHTKSFMWIIRIWKEKKEQTLYKGGRSFSNFKEKVPKRNFSMK